jgi:hypothetical protein
MRRTTTILVSLALLAGMVMVLSTEGVAATVVGARAGDLDVRGSIVIETDADFVPENGVRRGAGTKGDPFVIAGWAVPDLIVRDTSAHVVIRDNQIDGQLILNWNGHGVHAHHNRVHDLRVNENVRRTGRATGGAIHHNIFDVVGQLRHWGGIFEENVIGSEQLLQQDPDRKAVQFDGFHKGTFRDNTVFGYVDVKLHGHYHASSYKGDTHGHQPNYEVDEYGIPVGHHGNMHVKRYNRLSVYGNTIFSGHDWSLRYYDRNHDGDDRTANSETDKFLNGPHVHFTKVTMNGNRLVGAALMVDVFNPRNDNHWSSPTGSVELRGNTIELDPNVAEVTDARDGIVVQEARFMKLQIVGNEVFGPRLLGDVDQLGLEKELYRGAGIRLNRIEDAKIWLINNRVENRQFGIYATDFHSTVDWTIKGLETTNVKQDVYYERVPNPPRQNP